MPDSEQQSDHFLSKIIVPVIIALLVGGTSPWWWSEFISTNKTGNGSTVTDDVNSPNSQDSEQKVIDRINKEYRQRNAERDQYKSISLSEIENRTSIVGADRKAIAFNAFGLTSYEEGSSPSDLFVEDYTEYSVVTVISLHGGDDSVLGSRYRLEFEKIDEERWQVVWAGQQWKCVRSNTREWTTQLCP